MQQLVSATLVIFACTVDYFVLAGDVRARLYLLDQLYLVDFGLMPDFDQTEQQLEELREIVLIRRLKHQLFDEVNHLVN